MLWKACCSDFGVRGEIVKANPGPVVTLYELEPAPGIKSSRVIGLGRRHRALDERVVRARGGCRRAEMPSVSNCRTRIVKKFIFANCCQLKDDSAAKLPLCLGKNIGGESIIIDLARTPHMLIAGTTGSGKSVAINTMILSLVYRLRPDQCRLIMVDPKMLELSVYDGIPHLLTPVVTDPKKGRGRAQMGGPRDGRALQEDVEARRSQYRRLQCSVCVEAKVQGRRI